jgi:hypothetical protein
LGLYAWTPGEAAWKTSFTISAGDAERDPAVFLLRLEDTERGRDYEVRVNISGCPAGSASLGYMSYPANADTALRAFPGPGRIRPDSLVTVPAGPDDDASTRGQIAAWGSVINDIKWENEPGCEQPSVIRLEVGARGDSLFLAWAAGTSEGSASLSESVTVTATVSGVGEQSLQVHPPPNA